MGHELGSASDAKMAIEGGHVLMGSVITEREARGDFFLAVALHEARERLAEAWRELLRAWLRGADQGAPDERSEFPVEEVQEPHLPRREISLTDPAVGRNPADGASVRHLLHRHDRMVGPCRQAILVVEDGPVPRCIGH